MLQEESKAEDPVKGTKKVIVEPVKNPAEFAGAYAARLMTDIGTDGTRQFYWRYNHPLAIAEKAVEQAVPQLAEIKSPAKRGALMGGIGELSAALGTFDITNPGELFPSQRLCSNLCRERLRRPSSNGRTWHGVVRQIVLRSSWKTFEI